MIIYLFSEIFLIFVVCYSILLTTTIQPVGVSAGNLDPSTQSTPQVNQLSTVLGAEGRWTMIWLIIITFLLTLGVPEWNRSILYLSFAPYWPAPDLWSAGQLDLTNTIGMSYHFSPYIIVVRGIITLIFCLFFFLPYFLRYSDERSSTPGAGAALAQQGESSSGQINYLLIIILLSIYIILSSYDLILLYISMELLALSSYLLASAERGPRRAHPDPLPLAAATLTGLKALTAQQQEFTLRDQSGQLTGGRIEASLKYYIMGSISSAFYLLGTSFVYGVKGSINFNSLGANPFTDPRATNLMDNSINDIYYVGLIFIIFYFLFKLSIFPFHQWAPDVFQGVNMNITAFLAIISKSVFYFLFPYVLLTSLTTTIIQVDMTLMNGSHEHAGLGILGIISILLGSFLGLLQSNIKRLLAYSSISNGGFLMLALSSNTFIGYSAYYFYLIIYLISSLGLFSILGYPAFGSGAKLNSIFDLKFLVHKNPILALNFTIILFSLAGIPPLAGFISKFQIFYSLTSNILEGGAPNSVSQFIIIIFLALFLSLFAAFYYLRIIHFFYFWDESYPRDESKLHQRPDILASYLACFSALLIIILGIYPYPLIEFSTFLTLCID